MKKIRYLIAAAALLCALATGAAAAGPDVQQKNIILATTTSTQDSGLLDALLPFFEKQSGYFVKTIAVGSGQAIAMGAKGEADVLLVHSPADEKKFIDEGNGGRRLLIMHNDFIIVGPAADPAGIKTAKNAPEALKKIADKKALFLSRGDKSGTHSKEKKIWESVGINPEGASRESRLPRKARMIILAFGILMKSNDSFAPTKSLKTAYGLCRKGSIGKK